MQRTFICKGCGKEKAINPKLKGKQKYCGDAVCQRARKAAWQNQKMVSDQQYHADQHRCKKAWRQQRPADKYMHQYRAEHPKYVEQNRLAQKERNRRRDMIVKMDALKAEKPITCLVTPWKMDEHKKIVKMDAYLAEVAVMQQDKWPARAAAP